MAKKKSIEEVLASKYKRTKKTISRFEKHISLTKEEADWIRENEDEFYSIINSTETNKKYSVVAHEVTDGSVELVMSW